MRLSLRGCVHTKHDAATTAGFPINLRRGPLWYSCDVAGIATTFQSDGVTSTQHSNLTQHSVTQWALFCPPATPQKLASFRSSGWFVVNAAFLTHQTTRGLQIELFISGEECWTAASCIPPASPLLLDPLGPPSPSNAPPWT